MAHIQRLIRLIVFFIVGVFLGGLSVAAFAETVPATLSDYEPSFSTWSNSYGYTAGYKSTPQATCDATVPWYYGSTATALPVTMVNKTKYKCNGTKAGATVDVGYVTASAVCRSGDTYNSTTQMCVGYACPAGYQGPGTYNGQANMCSGCPVGKEDVGGVCKTVCPGGYHRRNPDDGQCEKDCIGDQVQQTNGLCKCTPGAKSVVSFQSNAGSPYYAGNGCANGCQYKIGPIAFGIGTLYSYGTRTADICGSNTTLTPAPPLVERPSFPPADTSGTGKDSQTPDPMNKPDKANDPVACGEAGGVYGTYNGVGKCLTPDKNNPLSTTKSSESSTTNSDGSKSSTKGSSTTTCDGTNCTTTDNKTTSTTDGNGVTKTSTTTSSGAGSGSGDQKDFCADHPQSIICKNSSWSGDCDQPPSCDGDAVACATAKAVWEHRCVNKWAEKQNPLSDAVDQENLFGDQAKADAALNKDGSKDIDILAKFIEKRQNYLTFASSCSPDLSFDFKGQHYQFDTTILCQFGLVIKILLHITAYMTLIRVFTTKLF